MYVITVACDFSVVCVRSMTVPLFFSRFSASCDTLGSPSQNVAARVFLLKRVLYFCIQSSSVPAHLVTGVSHSTPLFPPLRELWRHNPRTVAPMGHPGTVKPPPQKKKHQVPGDIVLLTVRNLSLLESVVVRDRGKNSFLRTIQNAQSATETLNNRHEVLDVLVST